MERSNRSTGTRRFEVATKLAAIRDAYGGASISTTAVADGKPSGGAYAGATLAALGVRFRSNALAQEKTGEFWVNGKMLGTGVRGDFEHAEVALFVGKSRGTRTAFRAHGRFFARSRRIPRER